MNLRHATTRFWMAAMAGLLLAVSGGCRGTGRHGGASLDWPTQMPPGPVDSQQTLHTLTPDAVKAVQRFNRAHGVASLWSRVEVRIVWIDDRDRRRSETAEGHFLARFPDALALSLGKLGQDGLFAGCNADRYWLIDLMADGGAMAYLGGSGSLRSSVESEARRLLPIRPDQLAWLMGQVPLDESHDGQSLEIQAVNGYWLLQPLNAPVRILMDPLTGQAARIDWVDLWTGRGEIICMPSRYRAVDGDSQAGTLATRLDIFVPASRAHISVELTDVQDGTLERRINPKLFDPAYLLDRHFRIPPDRRVDLEKPLPAVRTK